MTPTERHFDVVIIGAGPAGLFAALTLAPHLRVLMIDRKDRAGGAGGATDGKLNLSPHIGLDLEELRLTEEAAQAYIETVDQVFLEHGADPTLLRRGAGRIERVAGAGLLGPATDPQGRLGHHPSAGAAASHGQ